MNKLNTVQTFVFEYRTLENLVKELYGHDINIVDEQFIPFERLNNGSYQEWTVDGESELFDIDDDKIVAKWIETGNIAGLDMSDVEGYHFSTADVNLDHIMHRLYLEDHIPAGKYLMKVYW